MLAIVNIAGKQFKTSKDQVLIVPKLVAEIGKKIEFNNVLLYSDGEKYHYGKPNIKGASVTATILEHNREKKILIYKKKRRKGYQRKNGHRQWYSKIKIDSIKLSAAPTKSAPKPKKSSTNNNKKLKKK